MSKSSRRRVDSWPSEVLCSELVMLLTEPQMDGSESTAAIVEAISETEAVLSVESAIRRGRAIQVKASSWSFRALVVGCRKDEEMDRYTVLVRFEDSFRWTAEAFSPAHVLDLRSPMATAPRALAAGQSFWE